MNAHNIVTSRWENDDGNKDAGEMEHWKIHRYRSKMDTVNLTVQLCALDTHTHKFYAVAG